MAATVTIPMTANRVLARGRLAADQRKALWIMYPYRDGAIALHRAGWASPIPTLGKVASVSGFHGRGGNRPSYADIQAWCDGPEGSHNVAIRLPEHVIGLDVDDYNGKTGAITLKDCEAKWGELPATVVTTSRELPSGIRLYRVPLGRDFSKAENVIGRGGSHIEVIWAGNRYVMAPPSIHPDTGQRYRWLAADGSELADPPLVGECAELPGAWVTALTTAINGTSNGIVVGKPASSEHSGTIKWGERNKRLIAYAGHLRAANVPWEDAVRAFASRWSECEQPAGNELTWETAVANCLQHAYGNYRPHATEAVRSLVGTPYAKITEEKVTWLWPRYLARGKLHLLEGDPGCGKSTVATDLAARLSTGDEWPDGARGGKPETTLICTLEDDAADTVKPRLRHARADMSRVFHVHDGSMDAGFRLPDHLPLLESLISQHEPALVIVDPLSAPGAVG